MISSIYRMANAAPPTGQEAEERNRAARAEAWHRLGLVVIDPDEITDKWLRQAIVNEAERRYGRRTGRAGQ